MNIKGEAIEHKAFGCGVVTNVTAGIITVRFPKGEKKFIYPDAFEQYLRLQDGELQRQVAGQIEKKQAELDRQYRVKQAEIERRRKLLDFEIAANSHGVFHILPEQAAQARKTWTVSTGQYLSGYSKGQPRVANRLKPNSACLMTERPEGKPEEARRIIGAFMVREDFFGEDTHDGIVESHPEHRLLLPTGKQLLFWERFDASAVPRWGNTAFKYCSGTVMNQILAEMTEALAHTAQNQKAMAFYRYFCKINRLRPLVEVQEEAEAALANAARGELA